MDDLATICDEVLDADTDDEAKSNDVAKSNDEAKLSDKGTKHFNEKKATCKTQNLYFLLAFLFFPI